MSLDIKEVSLDEEQDISNTREKSRKSQGFTKGFRCPKCGVMYTNVERLSCGKVEDLGYFQNLDTKNNDKKAVTERVVVQTTVLQL